MRRLLFCLPFLAFFIGHAWADGLFAPPPPAAFPIASVSALASAQLPTVNAVALGGFYQNGDGGGGQLVRATCMADGGTCFPAGDGSTWKRVGPTINASVLWFGAKCDAVSTVLDGSITAGSNQFTSSAITFVTADIGKKIELNGAGNPWMTTISSVNGHVATLANNAFNNYPGTIRAKSADFTPSSQGGMDAPGAGYQPADTLTATQGTFSVAATATVQTTGLVAVTMTNGGSLYVAGDYIYLTPNTAGSKATIQVNTVDGGGAILTYTIIDGGSFKSTNPASFTQKSPNGSGFAFTLLASNASFGVASVKLAAGGTYTVLPPIPTATSDSGTGTGAQIELSFNSPDWTYGTDDTAALATAEAFAETSSVRGTFNGLNLPGGTACLANSLTINRPVSWTGTNSKATTLEMLLGSTGASVNGSPNGFVVVATGYPTNDTYQFATGAQTKPFFNNVLIRGMSPSTTVDVNNTSGISTSTDCMELTNPVSGSHSNTALLLTNVQIRSCPGNGLSAVSWSGELIGFDVTLAAHGGHCLDFEKVANPSRLYRIIASGCTGNGVNLVNTGSMEFHGAGVFGNTIDISVTGTRGSTAPHYIVFDSLQMGKSTNENMYLDQQAEVVICTVVCRFAGANQGGAGSGANDADLVIGPDVNAPTGLPQPVINLQNGLFTSQSTDNNVFFVTPACACFVNMDTMTTNTDTGIVATNNPDLLRSTAPVSSQAAPSISSGFGSSPSIVKNNGPSAFQVNVGGGGSASSGVIGLPTASNGWACSVADVTTPATNFTKQTASSTTTATFTNYNTSNVANGWTASDKLNASCNPY